MCRPGYLSNTVCCDVAEDPNLRPSHFPCWTCIKAEAHADVLAAARAEQDAIAKAREARERAVDARMQALKEKRATELRAKEERIRGEGNDRATKDREEESRIGEEEECRTNREEGLWIETGRGKKAKGRKSGGNSGLTTPVSAQPLMKPSHTTKDKAENSGERTTPKKDRVVDPGGRAGIWGPKKILSRRENDNIGKSGAAKDAMTNGTAGGKK